MSTSSLIRFGLASARYPKGYPHNFEKVVVLRWRPGETGADVNVLGARPRAWSTQVTVHSSSLVTAQVAIDKWDAERSQIRDLQFTDPGLGKYPGVLLMSVNIVTGPRRVWLATDGSNYLTGLQLTFCRVAETTPA